MQEVPPEATHLLHRLCKLAKASAYTADASADALQFSIMATAADVAGHRLLWWKYWTADVEAKTSLASDLSKGAIFLQRGDGSEFTAQGELSEESPEGVKQQKDEWKDQHGAKRQEGIQTQNPGCESSGGKTYISSEGGESFSHRYSLTKHQKRHTEGKPCKCLECGKSFTHRHHLIAHQSSLKTHQRTRTGDKLYECLECGKSFSCHHYLRLHQRTHTGDKPHKCLERGKSFRQNGEKFVHPYPARGALSPLVR
ncbi:zinc finger protein 418-like [Rhineura floridana]|uniref:zinc finger protein 418-like n=1 Tax=Rhineura floridana TaxID=261503 RepID=UPI002AC88044|nr:zinc finger protein 418-like [Rhineura floridana]